MISMPQQITEIQLFFKGGLSGTRHRRQSPFQRSRHPCDPHIIYRQRYDRAGSHVKVGGLAIEYGRQFQAFIPYYTPFFGMPNCGEGEILLTVISFYLSSYSYNFTPFNLFYGQQFTPSRSYNLGQHKWKTQTPPLPPPKSRMGKWRVFALRAASLLILGGRGFAVPFYFVQDCSSWFLGIVDVYLPSCKQQKVSPRPLIQVKTLAYTEKTANIFCTGKVHAWRRETLRAVLSGY